MSERVLDVSTLLAVASGPRATIWWGVVGLLTIEGTMFGLLVATYFYLRQNFTATIIDVSKREIIKRHEVGLELETTVLSPDEPWVSVSNESSNDIYFINAETATIAGKVGVPRNPRGMRFSADSRRLYVASEQEPMVSIIDVAEQKLIKSMATGGERPVDIVICPDGQRIYVSHGRSEDVRVFDAPTWKLLATIPVRPRAW